MKFSPQEPSSQPASETDVAPKRVTHQVSFFGQFLALQKKNVKQKLRSPAGCCLEILLPVFFILGLVGAWSATDTNVKPASQYADGPVDLGAMAAQMLCINATRAGEVPPLPGLTTCPSSDADVICFEENLLPVNGLCTRNASTAMGFIHAVAFFNPPFKNVSRYLPTLDEMIIIRWLGRGILGDFRTNAATYLQPDNSIALGSYLFFSGPANITQGMVDHLNATSAYFRYVYGGQDTDRERQVNWFLREENYGKVWIQINVNEVSPTLFDVTLSPNRTAIPWTHKPNRDFFLSGLGSQMHRNYYADGFLSVQLALQDYYVRQYHNRSNPAEPLNFAVMPLAAYTEGLFLILAGGFVPFVLVLAYLYSVSQLTKRMVEEKEKRLREGMMIMGLHKAGFYVSWLSTYAFQQLVSTILMTILLKATMLSKTDGFVTFLLLLLFSFATVTFSTFLSTLFSHARTAAVIAPLLYFATLLPSFAGDPSTATRAQWMGISCLPAGAFNAGTFLVFSYERTRGIGFGDAWSSSDAMKLGEVYIMLSANIVFYFLLTLYLDAVLPSEWGTRKHPLFCLLFWRKKKTPEAEEEMKTPTTFAANTLRENYAYSESEPSVRIRNLHREFTVDGTTKAAVNKISLDIYPNEVTVLLGQNGAGKTTTINMLTGMIDATSGDCDVYGRSILTDMAAIRSDIGFCPQHNILWDDLTVREHLQFYTSIKGLSGAEQERTIEETIVSTDLAKFADVLAGALSGGNKRKLSIANAFVGGSRLVFLDEPTAGMDVMARRHTWDLIRSYATNGRTIVLTTHFMDEADLLGSQIAIMRHGEIICSGSSLFLKNKLGVGYSLTVNLDAATPADSVVSTITNYVENAETVSTKGGEVVMRLPMSSVETFPALLAYLEDHKATLGVRSFGISITTLEEVFLRIAEGSAIEAKPGSPIDTSESPSTEGDSERAAPAVVNMPLSDKLWPDNCVCRCEPNFNQQLVALFKKRFHNAKRDRRTICFQIVCPALVIIFSLLLTSNLWTAPPPYRLTDAFLSTESHLDVPIDPSCGNMYPDGKWIATGPVNSTATAKDFSQYLLDTYDNHAYIRDIGFHCNGPRSTMFINSSSHHAAAVATTFFSEARTRSALNDSSVEVTFELALLPWTPYEEGWTKSFLAIFVGFFILIPFTFIPSTFVSYIVKERECRAKHLQMISGTNFVAYWLGNYIFDVISFLMTLIIVVIILAIFGRKEYIGTDAVGATFLLFILFGLAGVACAYLISFAFENHGTAQNLVMLLNFIAGFLLVMLIYILTVIDSTKDAGKALKWIFRLCPPYTLGEGIINLSARGWEATLGIHRSALHMDVTGWPIVYMALEAPIFLILTMLIDHPARQLRRQQMFHNPDTLPEPIEDEDDDVREERRLVESGARDKTDLVTMRHLCKKYSTSIGEKVAVKNLSFGVKRGEVFAFLGTNGAGKTTTMGILTGEHLPTHGHGFVVGCDVVSNAADARKHIGFCPQFDALNDLLTPEEHLYLYASLRGVPRNVIDSVVMHLLEISSLLQYRNVPAHQLSGGNKRKLSVAIALIGSPQVLFLDEPSAGMDPGSRRQLWSVIQRAARECSVVLTTHHLEEVEVLGDRVAIMVDGTLQCIGPLQHLKSKFGSGYEMMIKVRGGADIDETIAHVAEAMPTSQLTERKQQRLSYSLPQQGTKLSEVFRILRDNKDAWNVTDYSFAQTSLELVFLRIGEKAMEKEGDSPSHVIA